MALGLTQHLTEMSTGNISWGVKAAGAKGWQPYHLHVSSHEIWEPQPPGSLMACNEIDFNIANEAWKVCLCLPKAEDKKTSNT